MTKIGKPLFPRIDRSKKRELPVRPPATCYSPVVMNFNGTTGLDGELFEILMPLSGQLESITVVFAAPTAIKKMTLELIHQVDTKTQSDLVDLRGQTLTYSCTMAICIGDKLALKAKLQEPVAFNLWLALYLRPSAILTSKTITAKEIEAIEV